MENWDTENLVKEIIRLSRLSAKYPLSTIYNIKINLALVELSKRLGLEENKYIKLES